MNKRDLLIRKLLEDAYIVTIHSRKTLYEGNRRPILRVTDSLFRSLDKWHVLKSQGAKGRMIISIRSVQRLHGKNSIKKAYKKFRLEKRPNQKACWPCVVGQPIKGTARGPDAQPNLPSKRRPAPSPSTQSTIF